MHLVRVVGGDGEETDGHQLDCDAALRRRTAMSALAEEQAEKAVGVGQALLARPRQVVGMRGQVV